MSRKEIDAERVKKVDFPIWEKNWLMDQFFLWEGRSICPCQVCAFEYDKES